LFIFESEILVSQIIEKRIQVPHQEIQYNPQQYTLEFLHYVCCRTTHQSSYMLFVLLSVDPKQES